MIVSEKDMAWLIFKRRKFIKHLHIAKNKKFLLTE